jgi:uncharacterized protein (DUF433 family)
MVDDSPDKGTASFRLPKRFAIVSRHHNSLRGRATMQQLNKITHDRGVIGGKPCIRGLRVTVGTIVGLVANGYSTDDILKAYPYLQPDDIRQALTYAAGRVEEMEIPIELR